MFINYALLCIVLLSTQALCAKVSSRSTIDKDFEEIKRTADELKKLEESLDEITSGSKSLSSSSSSSSKVEKSQEKPSKVRVHESSPSSSEEERRREPVVVDLPLQTISIIELPRSKIVEKSSSEKSSEVVPEIIKDLMKSLKIEVEDDEEEKSVNKRSSGFQMTKLRATLGAPGALFNKKSHHSRREKRQLSGMAGMGNFNGMRLGMGMNGMGLGLGSPAGASGYMGSMLGMNDNSIGATGVPAGIMGSQGLRSIVGVAPKPEQPMNQIYMPQLQSNYQTLPQQYAMRSTQMMPGMSGMSGMIPGMNGMMNGMNGYMSGMNGMNGYMSGMTQSMPSYGGMGGYSRPLMARIPTKGLPAPSCPTEAQENIMEEDVVTEHYCRCQDGSYGFTCTENFGNPCLDGQQYHPAHPSLPKNYFIECVWGKPYLMKCAPATFWHQPYQTCVSDYTDLSQSPVMSQPPSVMAPPPPQPPVMMPPQPPMVQTQPPIMQAAMMQQQYQGGAGASSSAAAAAAAAASAASAAAAASASAAASAGGPNYATMRRIQY